MKVSDLGQAKVIYTDHKFSFAVDELTFHANSAFERSCWIDSVNATIKGEKWSVPTKDPEKDLKEQLLIPSKKKKSGSKENSPRKPASSPRKSILQSPRKLFSLGKKKKKTQDSGETSEDTESGEASKAENTAADTEPPVSDKEATTCDALDKEDSETNTQPVAEVATTTPSSATANEEDRPTPDATAFADKTQEGGRVAQDAGTKDDKQDTHMISSSSEPSESSTTTSEATAAAPSSKDEASKAPAVSDTHQLATAEAHSKNKQEVGSNMEASVKTEGHHQPVAQQETEAAIPISSGNHAARDETVGTAATNVDEAATNVDEAAANVDEASVCANDQQLPSDQAAGSIESSSAGSIATRKSVTAQVPQASEQQDQNSAVSQAREAESSCHSNEEPCPSYSQSEDTKMVADSTKHDPAPDASLTSSPSGTSVEPTNATWGKATPSKPSSSKSVVRLSSRPGLLECNEDTNESPKLQGSDDCHSSSGNCVLLCFLVWVDSISACHFYFTMFNGITLVRNESLCQRR